MRGRTASPSGGASHGNSQPTASISRRPSTVGGGDTQSLCIDSTTNKQLPPPVHLPFKVAISSPLPAAQQHSPSDQQLPMQEHSVGQTCSLTEGGRLSQPVSAQPVTASSTDSKAAAGCPPVDKLAGKQQLSGMSAARTQQQQVVNTEALLAAALTSQSCSVPTDLEVIDQLFDELVMLDPNFSNALAHAPPIQFETFVSAGNSNSNAANDSADNTDIHRTFLTACEVPESESQQAEAQPSSSSDRATPVFPRMPSHPGQRHPGALGHPEVAASADLFTWKASSQSGSGGRLQSYNFEPAAQQQSSPGSTGVRWADGGYVSSSGGAHDHNPRNHRLYASSPPPGLSMSLAHLPKPQDPHEIVALLSSQQFQQPPPNMDELQYQMDDIRKLHLSTVTTPSPILATLRAQQLQQQQQAANRAISAGSRRTADSLPSFRMNPSKWQGPMSARQQQAYLQDLAVLQPSKPPGQGQAVQKSFVGMKASTPSWKRK